MTASGLHVKSRAGEVFDPATVDQDVKAILQDGIFSTTFTPSFRPMES